MRIVYYIVRLLFRNIVMAGKKRVGVRIFKNKFFVWFFISYEVLGELVVCKR